MSESLLQTLIGFSVVIIGMVLLTGIIILFSKIMEKSTKQKPKVIQQVTEPLEQIANVYAQTDDEQEIAAIIACIEVYLQQSSFKGICNIMVKPLVRSSTSSAWSQAGRIDLVNRKA